MYDLGGHELLFFISSTLMILKITLLFALRIDYIFHLINTLAPVASPRLCQHLIALFFHALGPRGTG